MTQEPAAVRQPDRRVRSNRARILAVARTELGINPDVSMDDIARAAGLVRRTLYGHFPGREALLDALAEEASDAIREALDLAADDTPTHEVALARFALATWEVGDRYRMLLTLGRRHLGDDRFTALLLPAQEHLVGVLAAGQRDGVFSDHLPAAVLAPALEALCLSLLESVNDGTWPDPDAMGAAVASLVGAGITPERAARIAREVRGTL